MQKQSERFGNENYLWIPKDIDSEETLLRCISHPGDYNKKGDTFLAKNFNPSKGKTDVSVIRACHCPESKAKSYGLRIASKRPDNRFIGFFHFSPFVLQQAWNFHFQNFKGEIPFKVYLEASPIFNENNMDEPWPTDKPLCQEFGFFPAHADFKYSIPLPGDENGNLRDHFRAFAKVLYDHSPKFLTEPENTAEEWGGPALCQQKKSA